MAFQIGLKPMAFQMAQQGGFLDRLRALQSSQGFSGAGLLVPSLLRMRQAARQPGLNPTAGEPGLNLMAPQPGLQPPSGALQPRLQGGFGFGLSPMAMMGLGAHLLQPQDPRRPRNLLALMGGALPYMLMGR